MQDIRNNVSKIEEIEQNWIENNERWQQQLLSARNQKEYISTNKRFQEHMEMLRAIAMKVYKKQKRQIIRESITSVNSAVKISEELEFMRTTLISSNFCLITRTCNN